MYVDWNGPELATIMADEIERNLENYLAGKFSDIWYGFGYPELEDLRDPNLRAAWSLADSFADSASHGLRDMDGAPWEEAIPCLREVIRALRSEAPLPRWDGQRR